MTTSLDQVIKALRFYNFVPLEENAREWAEASPTFTLSLPPGHENMWIDSHGDTITTLFPETSTYGLRFDGDDSDFATGTFDQLLVDLAQNAIDNGDEPMGA